MPVGLLSSGFLLLAVVVALAVVLLQAH